MKPAKPAGERENTPAPTPALGTRSMQAERPREAPTYQRIVTRLSSHPQNFNVFEKKCHISKLNSTPAGDGKCWFAGTTRDAPRRVLRKHEPVDNHICKDRTVPIQNRKYNGRRFPAAFAVSTIIAICFATPILAHKKTTLRRQLQSGTWSSSSARTSALIIILAPIPWL